jgi:hypothetical protein
MHKPSYEDLYAAKYIRFALEATNGRSFDKPSHFARYGWWYALGLGLGSLFLL